MKKLKHSGGDFLIENLPHNRREEFRDILSHRWRTLFLIGLVLLFFSLPALAISLLSSYNQSAYLLANEGLSQEELFLGLAPIKEVWDLYLIPALLFLYLGLAGIFKIFHELAWGEPVMFFHDFVKGVKENWQPFVFVALFVGGMNFLDGFVYDLSSLPIIVRILPFLIDADLLWPMSIVLLSLSSIYKMKPKTLFYDSFALYLKGFPFTLLFALGVLTPLLLDYVSIAALRYGLLALIILFLAPILFLAYELFFAHLYDVHLNSSIEGQSYRGLFHIEE